MTSPMVEISSVPVYGVAPSSDAAPVPAVDSFMHPAAPIGGSSLLEMPWPQPLGFSEFQQQPMMMGEMGHHHTDDMMVHQPQSPSTNPLLEDQWPEPIYSVIPVAESLPVSMPDDGVMTMIDAPAMVDTPAMSWMPEVPVFGIAPPGDLPLEQPMEEVVLVAISSPTDELVIMPAFVPIEESAPVIESFPESAPASAYAPLAPEPEVVISSVAEPDPVLIVVEPIPESPIEEIIPSVVPELVEIVDQPSPTLIAELPIEEVIPSVVPELVEIVDQPSPTLGAELPMEEVIPSVLPEIIEIVDAPLPTPEEEVIQVEQSPTPVSEVIEIVGVPAPNPVIEVIETDQPAPTPAAEIVELIDVLAPVPEVIEIVQEAEAIPVAPTQAETTTETSLLAEPVVVESVAPIQPEPSLEYLPPAPAAPEAVISTVVSEPIEPVNLLAPLPEPVLTEEVVPAQPMVKPEPVFTEDIVPAQPMVKPEPVFTEDVVPAQPMQKPEPSLEYLPPLPVSPEAVISTVVSELVAPETVVAPVPEAVTSEELPAPAVVPELPSLEYLPPQSPQARRIR